MCSPTAQRKEANQPTMAKNGLLLSKMKTDKVAQCDVIDNNGSSSVDRVVVVVIYCVSGSSSKEEFQEEDFQSELEHDWNGCDQCNSMYIFWRL